MQESPSHTIDIVAFIPDKAIDPIFYDKAYYLAPDKRGGKPYNLLIQAMRESGRVALAKWAWKAKQYVVQVRPGRRRPRPAAAPLRRRSALDEGARHREGHRLAGRAEARDAADRADQRGHLRSDDVRGRGEEAHPGRDRREDRRQADRRQRAARAGVGRCAGDRPGRGAAREPGQGRRPQGQGGGAGEHGTGQGGRAGRRPPAAPSKERKGVKRAAKVEEAPPARTRARK